MASVVRDSFPRSIVHTLSVQEALDSSCDRGENTYYYYYYYYYIVSFSDEWLVLQTLYVLSTFIFGFSIWADLRKRIQTARIDSVMKIQ